MSGRGEATLGHHVPAGSDDAGNGAKGHFGGADLAGAERSQFFYPRRLDFDDGSSVPRSPDSPILFETDLQTEKGTAKSASAGAGAASARRRRQNVLPRGDDALDDAARSNKVVFFFVAGRHLRLEDVTRL